MAFIEIENLSFTYSGEEQAALSDLSLSVKKGEFVLIVGESGCGKTTLLRLIKSALSPNGKKTGKILFDGSDVTLLDARQAASQIGFVMQNPDRQIVAEKVNYELAFALENLGVKSDVIRRKVAEVCGYLGISYLYEQKTCNLSGGQKQLLNLACVMAVNPSLLLLDEPTAQLDPVAASDFLAKLKKLSDEFGITVIMAEHRIEEVFAMADKAVFLKNGKNIGCFAVERANDFLKSLPKDQSEYFMRFMPASVKLFNRANASGNCPLTVKQAKSYFEKRFESLNCANKKIASDETCGGEISDAAKTPISAKTQNTAKTTDVSAISEKQVAILVKEGYFRYERDLPDVLKSLDLTVYDNEILCIFGANGAGKTTLLKVLGGVNRLYKGVYRLRGKKLKEYSSKSLYRNNLAMLPQNPQDLFLKNTLREDLYELTALLQLPKSERDSAVLNVARQTGITELLSRHPYDLSGGEQQKAALAKILLMQPQIILMDEPTKGLDVISKQQFANLIVDLKKSGKTIVISTHDVEFASEFADRCAMFFDGKIVFCKPAPEFFTGNAYYTTASARIMRGINDKIFNYSCAKKFIMQSLNELSASATNVNKTNINK